MSQARLDFHPLTFVEESDGITVGRPDIESYAVLPADGAALLRQLTDGASVPEAARWYNATFGEPIDMTDFVSTLHELGFVRAADEPADEPIGEGRPRARRLRFQALGRWALSPVAWVCYAALVGGALLAMAEQPQLRPHPENVFFTPSLILVPLLLLLVQVPALLWHEGFHVLAARRLGVPSRLSIGRRLYFVVFETQLNGLLSVPRRRRYLPFLAGILADVLLVAGLTLAAAIDRADGLSGLGRFALAVAYITVLRIAWQFYIFLRTDLYYVLTTALGCTNLHEATSAFLRDRFSWLPGVRPRPADAQEWSARDRRVAPWFALLTAGGVGFLLVTALYVVLPVVVEFTTRLGNALADGTTGGAAFWDSAVSLLLIALYFVVLPLWAGRRRNRGPEPRGTST
jgi:hypothetical protein